VGKERGGEGENLGKAVFVQLLCCLGTCKCSSYPLTREEKSKKEERLGTCPNRTGGKEIRMDEVPRTFQSEKKKPFP